MISLPPESPLEDCREKGNFTRASGRAHAPDRETSGQEIEGFQSNLFLGTGFVRVEYIFDDKVPIIENVPASVASREVSTFNASFGIRWENGFEAMLWGRNLNNDDYLLSAFPSVAQAGSFSGYPSEPRTCGLTLSMRF